MGLFVLALGTAAGTVIQNQVTTGTGTPGAGQAVVTYDGGGPTLGAQNSDSVSTTVATGYEIDGTLAAFSSATVTPNSTVWSAAKSFKNQGNANDTLVVAVKYDSSSSITGTWTVYIDSDKASPYDASQSWTSTTHPTCYAAYSLGADGTYTFYIGVKASASASDGDSLVMRIRVACGNPGTSWDVDSPPDKDNWPPDGYDGDSIQAEGSGDEEDYTQLRTWTVSVVVPKIYVDKTVTPTGSQLPFSELTYTIKFDNDGGGTAYNFKIIEHACWSGDNVDYKVDSAETSNAVPTGATSYTVEYSTDGSTWNGSSWDGTNDSDSSGYLEDGEVTDLYIRWSLNGNVSADDGDDTSGSCDGPNPDSDAGYVKYTVLIE